MIKNTQGFNEVIKNNDISGTNYLIIITIVEVEQLQTNLY